jgi:phenylalanyl-tRNA synthetase beta chain
LVDENYVEKQLFSLAIAGRKESEQWNNSNNVVSFFDIKAPVDAIIKRLKVEGIRVEEYEGTYFDYGLSYKKGEKVLVSLGAVSKKNLKKADVDGPVFFAQFDFDLLVKVIKKNKITYKEVSKFPSVRRDLALLLDESVSFEQLRLIANKTERKLLKEVQIFDVYKGDKLPSGKKSYALSFILQDEEKTLTDKQIDTIIQKLIINFEKEVGATVR